MLEPLRFTIIQPVVPFLLQAVVPGLCLSTFAFWDHLTVLKKPYLNFKKSGLKSKFSEKFLISLVIPEIIGSILGCFPSGLGIPFSAASCWSQLTSQSHCYTDGRWAGFAFFHFMHWLSNNTRASFLGHWIICASLSEDLSEIHR